MQASPAQNDARQERDSLGSRIENALKKAGPLADVPDKTGWLYKHSVGRSVFGMRNWKCRHFVSNVEGLAWFSKEPFDRPTDSIGWDAVTHVYPIINSAIDSAAKDPDSYYFGLRFFDDKSAGQERLLVLRCDNSAERRSWTDQLAAMHSEYQRISSMLEEDDEDEDGGGEGQEAALHGPKNRQRRRAAPRNRTSLLESLQTKLRTAVSLKKQRFVKDGIDLDLAYVGEKIVAMGFPCTGSEAVFRNPMADVVEFFDRYHPRKFKVYNLCSERSYPPSAFEGAFERYPFDDHNAPPLALVPPFVASARRFMESDPKHVIAVHCKAGKGRTGMMICCLLMANRTCTNAQESLEYFATKRTRDGKGVQIPSQIRFIGYFEQMLRQFNGRLPPTPLVRLTSVQFSSTPRFDPDGGCDPYVVVWQRVVGHQHQPMGQAEGKLGKQLEAVYNSSALSPPVHIRDQKNYTLKLDKCVLPRGGEFRIEVIDQDQLSSDDTMLSLWLHSGLLPESGSLTFRKHELDDAVKDKKHELFDEDFVLTINFVVLSDIDL